MYSGRTSRHPCRDLMNKRIIETELHPSLLSSLYLCQDLTSSFAVWIVLSRQITSRLYQITKQQGAVTDISPLLLNSAHMERTAQSAFCHCAHVTWRVMCLAVTTRSPWAPSETRRKELLLIDRGQLKDSVSFIAWNWRNQRFRHSVYFFR